ncbi:recombinase family protein [uncultured Pelagimonas sp.]|uniref:recombinase family protein n=1 Tax=uncultured Pelagimonas sp. TaxID=1618102 RepID=UPI002604878E|nr:recombinase family protein [uncultured Pelagimonas sp.]
MNSHSPKIGYAAPSTLEPNLETHITTLTAAGCSMIIRTEQKSGTTLDFIHPGETLMVTRIDRLASSMHDLQIIVTRRKEKGAHLAAIEQLIDTSTAVGKTRSSGR